MNKTTHMNRFQFHFAIDLRTIAIFILLIVLFALPFVALAQDESSPPEDLALLTIPPVLLTLIAINNRGTELVKGWLKAPQLPFTPSPTLSSFIVGASSIVIGIVSATFVPDALSFLPEQFSKYPIAGVVAVGMMASFGGATAQVLLDLITSLKPKEALYSTTTTVNVPPANTSDSVAKATVGLASQVAGDAKG